MEFVKTKVSLSGKKFYTQEELINILADVILKVKRNQKLQFVEVINKITEKIKKVMINHS